MERKTDKVMKKFAENIAKKYPDAKIFLFGSRTGKDFLKNSDFDVLIVSRHFEGENFYARPVSIYEQWQDNASLDAFCYTPQEFEEKMNRIGFIQEAMKNAHKIK